MHPPVAVVGGCSKHLSVARCCQDCLARSTTARDWARATRAGSCPPPQAPPGTTTTPVCVIKVRTRRCFLTPVTCTPASATPTVCCSAIRRQKAKAERARRRLEAADADTRRDGQAAPVHALRADSVGREWTVAQQCSTCRQADGSTRGLGGAARPCPPGRV